MAVSVAVLPQRERGRLKFRLKTMSEVKLFRFALPYQTETIKHKTFDIVKLGPLRSSPALTGKIKNKTKQNKTKKQVN